MTSYLENANHFIRFARGREFNFGKAKNYAMPWKEFKNIFRDPTRTSETMREYLKMSVSEQVTLKALYGWVYRTQIEGKKRNAKSGKPAGLLSLDFDYATPEFLADLRAGKILPGIELFVHSSRRHTPESPRLRVFIPLAEPVDNDTYGALSRIISQDMEPTMGMVDKVSFRKAQMMFLPTLCADSEYVFIEQEGELLDWNERLEIFDLTEGDWHDVSILPRAQDEDSLRETSEKAENPEDKAGPVGDFCRAYDVPAAIDAFLSDVYEETDEPSGKQRYTYLGGTTTNGAEVQDDGLFLYSHHGSDPAADLLLNAFDLVRIHKFGKRDEGKDLTEVSMGKHPSFTAMMEFIKEDPNYHREAMASRYDQAAMQDDFDAAAEAQGYTAEIDRAPKNDSSARKKKDNSTWMSQLELTKDNDIKITPANVALIIANDNRLCGAIAYNEFTQKTVLRHEFLTKSSILGSFKVEDPVSGDLWSDAMTDAIRIMLSIQNGPSRVGWGLKATSQDVRAAIDAAARVNPFHPVRDYLEGLTHDGQSRVDRLWIDYAGSPDNAYYREAAKTFMVACVARIYEPGHKFDFVPILYGKQGKRKSTFVELLACDWFGELKAKFSDENKLVEQMQGCWIMEIPELSGVTKSIIEDVKAFVSATKTQVRLAYGHASQVFKRQCCFVGSTNEDRFLVDHTGNRRWWPIQVRVGTMDTELLLENREQLWAEALATYRAMRAEQPKGTLPLFLTSDEAQTTAIDLQESAEMNDDVDALVYEIENYLNKPDQADEIFNNQPGAVSGVIWREKVAVAEIWKEAFKQAKPPNSMESRNIRKALNKLDWHSARGDVRQVRGEDGQRHSSRFFRPSDEADAHRRNLWDEKQLANSEPTRELSGDIDDDDDIYQMI